MKLFSSTLVAAGVLAFAAAPAAAQNLLLNGDFENNTAGTCQLNPNNATFNSLMMDCTAFGMTSTGFGEIDIMDGACGWGPVQSGSWKIGIACNRDNDTDALSLKASSPLAGGQTYNLSIWLYSWITTWAPDTGAVEVGLSANPSAFGTLVATISSTANAWGNTTTAFTAPAGGGQYLTIRVERNLWDSWIHVDDVSVSPGGLVLTQTGTCPGQITFSVTGGNGSYALIYGPAGTFTKPSGQCAGTTVAINPPTLGAAIGPSFTVNVPANACGLTVQAVDFQTCIVSNPIVL